MQSRHPTALTLCLDAELLAQLERAAASQLVSIEDYARSLLERAAKQQGVRRVKGASPEGRSPAPLDAFLPEGVDPFASNEGKQVPAAALSFEDIQARMRFAGTPALLRGE
jgi:hypothetical protein